PAAVLLRRICSMAVVLMRKRSSIVVSVVGVDRVSDEDLASWSSAQQEDAELVRPFFRPEFAQIVAAVRADVAVGVVRTETEPAFFPFQRRRFGGGVAVGGRLSD